VTRSTHVIQVPFDRSQLHPGMRVAVAVSGGADSVALLRVLAEAASELGIVLTVAHVHHGIRGAEADEDQRFVAGLAASLGLEILAHRVDTPVTAREKKQTLEEAARELRYTLFRELLAQGTCNAVATAHTLDDQAETVLHRLLRGAWTEGLAGIHPTLQCTGGLILRPFLETRREELRSWLSRQKFPWREDATNRDIAHTRNRIRHELLPRLSEFNPQVSEQLAHLATIARDEETWWDAELARLLPGLVLPGKPVRGGGRSVPTHPDEGTLGIELERLRALAPAVRRRSLRAAAKQLQCPLNFEQTERLMAMCQPEGPRKQELTAVLSGERSARELRLVRKSASAGTNIPISLQATIPGELSGLGVCLRLSLRPNATPHGPETALLRTPRPSDRVRIRYSRGAKPLKEIFERMQVAADVRGTWPLLEYQNRIVWMKGVDVDPEPDLPFMIEILPGE
jgi:tRNA(Ile)-lysidine synthase